MPDSIPRRTFLDRLDDYLPQTIYQVEEALNGKPIIKSKSPEERRAYCTRNCFKHIVLLPVEIPYLLLNNTSHALWKIAVLASRTFLVVAMPWRLPTHARLWGKTLHQLIDYSVAILVSPIQPFLKITRLFIGMMFPRSFFLKTDSLLMRRQLEIKSKNLNQFFYRKLKKSFRDKKIERPWHLLKDNETYPSSVIEGKKVFYQKGNAAYTIKIDQYAMLTIMGNLYDYSERWHLITSHAQGFTHNKGAFFYYLEGYRHIKRFSKLPQDPIHKKYLLFDNFKKLFEQWEKNSASINETVLKTFIKDNFKTARQKQIVDDYFKKIPTKENKAAVLSWILCPRTCKKNGKVHLPETKINKKIIELGRTIRRNRIKKTHGR